MKLAQRSAKNEKRFVIRREVGSKQNGLKIIKFEVGKVWMVKIVQRKNGVKSEMRNVIRREVGWNF